MGGQFRPGRRPGDGYVTATFSPDERGLLEALARQLAELVAPPEGRGPDSRDPLARLVGFDGGEAPRRPDDSALRRLLPDAYRDDEGAADEFRRFTERGLREGKQADAEAVLAGLERADAEGPGRRAPVRLDAEQAQAWLRHLNDVRLVLGEQLGLSQAEHPEELIEDLTPDDPRFGLGVVYDWLTAVQGTLVEALWSRERREG